MQHLPRPLPFLLQILQQEFGGEPKDLQAALSGLERYQSAPRVAPWSPPPAILSHGRAKLLHYGGSGTAPCAVFVPSLINGPHILDIDPDRSMLRWLARHGIAPHLIDWGTVDTSSRAESLDYYVSEYLVPLIKKLDRPVHLVGYCLGGTMALAAASLTKVASLSVIASPWDFGGYEDHRRQEIVRLWQTNQMQADYLGLFPMEVLQTGFWSLDPLRVANKFKSFNSLPAEDRGFSQFVTTEDWANSGEPLPLAAARQLFEQFYEANAGATGQWKIADRLISPDAITAPSLSIRSKADQIVPAATSPVLADNWTLETGHVGMVIGSRRKEQLWRPLAQWIKGQAKG